MLSAGFANHPPCMTGQTIAEFAVQQMRQEADDQVGFGTVFVHDFHQPISRFPIQSDDRQLIYFSNIQMRGRSVRIPVIEPFDQPLETAGRFPRIRR